MHSPYENEKNNNVPNIVVEYFKLKAGESHHFFDEEDFEMLLDYFAEMDNMKEAKHAVEFALERYPSSAEMHFRKADMLIAGRSYYQANEILNDAFVLDNANLSYYILKVDVLMALEKQEQANDIFLEAIAKFYGEDLVEFLFEVADVYDDYEEFEKVFECFVQILEVEPNNEEALYKVCFWADYTGRLEESIQLHTKIIDSFPYNEIAWFNLGAAFQSLKLYEKAIDAYLYALAIEDKFEYAYRNVADAYIKLRKYVLAIEALEKVIELSTPEEVIYEAIGFCHHKTGNLNVARKYYKLALGLNKTDAKLHFKIANTYMMQLQWEMAVKHLTHALLHHKNNKEFNLAMGECKVQLGEHKEAIAYFGKVVKAKPTQADGWEALIRSFIMANELEEALKHCKIALEYVTKKTSLLYFYSALLFLNKNTKEALIQLHTALSQNARMLKKALQIAPDMLHHPMFVDVIAAYKKKRKF